MIEHDPGRALTAMAHAVNAGHEPRALAEALVRHLRNGFLSLMAPELVQLSPHQVDELAAQAQRLGPAALVRGIERLGEILVELRHAPDPRVLVEVALVQLTTAAAGRRATTSAPSRPASPSSSRPSPAAGRPAAAAAPVDPATGRTALGGRARRSTHGAGRRPRPRRRRRRRRTPAPATPPPAPLRPTSSGSGTQVRPTLRGMARPLYTPRRRRRRRAATRSRWPRRTPPHRAKCEQHRGRGRAGVGGGHRAAGHDRAGRSTATQRPAPAAAARRAPRRPTTTIDLDDLVDAAPGTVPTTLDRLAEAFPGAELVEGRELTWRAPTRRRSRR